MSVVTRVVLLSLLLASPAWATDYYVANGGPASNCTQAQNSATPLASIVAGIHCLQSGDTLLIRGGTYAESWTVQEQGAIAAGSSWSNPTTIKAYPGETVTWTPPSTDCVYMGGAGPNMLCAYVLWIGFPEERFIQFEGIKFDGIDRNLSRGLGEVHYPYSFPVSSERPDGKAILGDHPSDILFLNCEWTNFHGEFGANGRRITFRGGKIHHVGSSNGLRHMWYPSVLEDFVVENMELYDNVNGYVFHGYQEGKDVNNFRGTIFRNNYIHDIGLAANGAVSGASQDAILMGYSSDGWVYGNVFENIGGAAVDIGHIGPASNIRIFHNTFVQTCLDYCPGGVIYITYNSNHFCQNNIFWQNGNQDVYGPFGDTCNYAGNLSGTNPLFVSPATHNYHLNPLSPAIGHGVPGTGITHDLEGNPYPSPPDSGAYAFGTAFSPLKGTFHVAPTGSDGTACDTARNNVGAPLATVSKALSCAAGESTIYLRQGTYSESIQTSTTPIAAGSSFSAPTTIASYPGETATLQRTSAGAIIELSGVTTDQYLVFDRLVLDGLDSAGTYGFQVGAGAQHIRFQNGEIKRVAHNGVYLAGATTEILNTQIHDNVGSGFLVVILGGSNVVRGVTMFNSISGAVFLVGATDTLIERSTLRNNAARGLRTQNGSNNKAFNNLIYSNTGDGIVVESGDSGLLLYHNTVWNNSALGLNIFAGASSTAYTNNIFTGNGTDTPSNSGTGTIPTTNVVGSPSFIAPGPPITFHVEGANVVHQGTTLAAVTTDFAGKGRSATPGYTIGAFQDDEVGGGPPPTGNVYYTQASCSGCDSNSCGQAQNISTPKQTIQAGVDCLTPGDTLYLRAGTYTPADRVLYSLVSDAAHPTTIAGYPGDARPVLRPGTISDFAAIKVHKVGVGDSYLTLRGFDIDAINGPGNTNCLALFMNHTTVDDMTCTNAARNGIEASGSPVEPANYAIVRNSRFFNCGRIQPPEIDFDTKGPGLYLSAQFMLLENNLIDGCRGGGIEVQFDTSRHSIIRNNVIRNAGCASHWGCITDPPMETHGKGIVIGGTDQGGIGGGATDNQIYNNVLYNLVGSTPSTQGYCFGWWGGATGNLVANNTCYNAPAALFQSGTATSETIQNNVFANMLNADMIGDGATLAGTIDHNLYNPDVAATFVNAPGGDLRLHAPPGNPAIDTGVAVAAVTTGFNDLAGVAGGSAVPGVPRPSPAGGAYDLGAYEYGSVAVPPTVSLTANPTSIASGGSSTLSWTSSGATSCSAPWTTSTATSGSQSVSPTTTTTYTMTCTDGATPASANAMVTVAATPGVSLTASPQTITQGEASTLSWTSSNVTSCSAPWTGSTATSGSQSVSPTVTTTYTITCTDGTTPVISSATVTVNPLAGQSVRGLPYATSGFFVLQ